MLVKVFIKRRVKEGKAMEVFKMLRKIRLEAMNQDGYISGETLFDPDDSKNFLVVSTWQSMDNWLSWKENSIRIAENEKLEPLLEKPTEYESYVYSKYYLKVSSNG